MSTVMAYYDQGMGYPDNNWGLEGPTHDFSAAAQSFQGNGDSIVSCKFRLHRYGSPTGNVYARIYAITGSYGTTSKPNGNFITYLAISDPVAISSITNTADTFLWYEFTFSTPYQTTNGTYYCVGIDYILGDDSNNILVARSTGTAGFAGNASSGNGVTPTWNAEATDLNFYVYGQAAAANPGNFFQVL